MKKQLEYEQKRLSSNRIYHLAPNEIFLSANGLKYLVEVLWNSPILKQFDYYEEDVKKNMVRT